MEMSKKEIPEFSEELNKHKEIGRLMGNWHDRVILHKYLNDIKKKENGQDDDLNETLTEIRKNKVDIKNKLYIIIG